MGREKVVERLERELDEQLIGPFSNSGFKTGPCQFAWSGFENARSAKFGRDLEEPVLI